ncbi:MAG TPA: TIGR00730 family Rossman fold protein [Candidatus Rubrimentiphilum sp.]|nr:TIGR00730 family Rossman fold protein [Candidatus Rubrimentiphilum sp.]
MTARIGVFCGSYLGNKNDYAETAAAVARAIVGAGYGIVYGGGSVGLMGVIADSGLAAGGEVIGIIPQALCTKEIAHAGLSKLHVVNSMHERKALMADLSAAFIALPGGFGTMDEFCEILTWAQLHIHAKPVGLLNCSGYYDELIVLFDKMVREGFVLPANRKLVHTAETIDRLLETMLSLKTPLQARD